jgi:MSHA biogenesis protein MshJ
MKEKIQALSSRFAALNRREKAMVAIAGILLVGMGGFALGVDPVRTRIAVLDKQLAQQRQDTATLRDQLVALSARLASPQSERKKAIADVQAEQVVLEKERQSYDDMLVPPRMMSGMLQSLLARHRGLELVGVRTLAPVPLIERRKGADAKAPGAREDGANVYRHGIEITIAGSYPDLLNYAAELEQSQRKLLREKMSLVVKQHPRCELTLTLYTLSLDATWLRL